MEKLTKKEKELKAHDEKRRLERLLQNGHKKPITRRDFISLGLMSGAASVIAPSLLGMLTSKVYAGTANCASSSSGVSPMIPMIIIDLIGGHPLVNEFMVGGRGGQKDLIAGVGGDNSRAYNNFGIPDALNYYKTQPNEEFGVRFHRDSAFLMGLKAGLNNNSALYPSIDGATIACALNSDSDENLINPMQGAVRLGRTGVLMPCIGTLGTVSGGYSKAATGTTSALFTPTRIATQSDAVAVMTGGTMVNALGAPKADKIRRQVANMTSSQLSAFSNLAINDQLSTVVDCGYLSMADLPNKYNAATFFGTDTNLTTAFGDPRSQGAIVSKLLKEGAAGAATIALGNYDSHDNTAGHTRDMSRAVGLLIGQIITYFSLSNMGVFIGIITDGSMGTGAIDDQPANSTYPGTNTTTIVGGGGFLARPGDSDATSMAAMMTFVPGTKRGDLVQMEGRQIGSYTAGGVERNYLITANSATNAGLVMLNNYLALHGKQASITEMTGAAISPFGGANTPFYEVFKKVIKT